MANMKEMKNISCEISYEVSTENRVVRVLQKAHLCFGTETQFHALQKFLRDMDMVIQEYKKCAENIIPCNVYLSVATYYKPEDRDLETQSFDGWHFEGVPSSDDEGLYLSPDVRYTNETHDIYIDFSKPLIDQLAEAHI